MKLCDYGCGREAKYQMTSGKWCCEDFYSKCPAIRKKNSDGLKLNNPSYSKEVNKKRSNTLQGHYVSNITKDKIREKLLNYYRKGNKPWNVGYGDYISGEKNPWYNVFGEYHPGWKGGISQQPYCPIFSNKEWRELIYERDNYSCQMCGCTRQLSYMIHEKNLCIHHIDYNKENCHPENCITICNRCNLTANKDRNINKFKYRIIMIGIIHGIQIIK